MEKYPCQVGDSIHVTPFEGIYRVTQVNYRGFTITCNKWLNRGYKTSETMTWDKFKVKKGGAELQKFEEIIISCGDSSKVKNNPKYKQDLKEFAKTLYNAIKLKEYINKYGK